MPLFWLLFVLKYVAGYDRTFSNLRFKFCFGKQAMESKISGFLIFVIRRNPRSGAISCLYTHNPVRVSL
jgi:hypothetical protein